MVAKSSECKTVAQSNGDKQFKGVRRRSWGKWVSEIRLPNTRARLWLGSYATAEQAARAFDVAVVCLRGRSAALNFPESPPAYAPLGLPHHQIQELAAAAATTHACPSATTAQPGNDLEMPSAGIPSMPATSLPEMSEELDTATSEASNSHSQQAAEASVVCVMKGDSAAASEELPCWDEAHNLQTELLMNSDWDDPLWGRSAVDCWITASAELLPVEHYDNDNIFASMADPHGLWSL